MEAAEPGRVALWVGLSIAALISPWTRLFAYARWLALLVMTVKFVWLFPHGSNHFGIEYLLAIFLALLNPGVGNDRALLLRAGRVVVVLVLFWSGLQKLRYGTYLHGSFFAAWVDARNFSTALGLVVPADELARVRALSWSEGTGEYALHSWRGLLISNSVFFVELAAALSLLIPKTRPLGLALALAALAGIEFAARELFFGVLMLNLLALYVPRHVGKALLTANILVCVCLVLAASGLWVVEDFN